jgi:hypothetical protein
MMINKTMNRKGCGWMLRPNLKHCSCIYLKCYCKLRDEELQCITYFQGLEDFYFPVKIVCAAVIGKIHWRLQFVSSE